MFMNLYTSSPMFERLSATLAPHPLLSSLFLSLLYDNCSISCTIGLTILVKLLPMLAVHASTELKTMIPRLFAVFARVLCWKERLSMNDNESDAGFADNDKNLQIPVDTKWQRLELKFGISSSPPSAVRLFTYLYYLFPCNTLRFLRGPIEYFAESSFECPYVGGWAEALDVIEIMTRSEVTHLTYFLLLNINVLLAPRPRAHLSPSYYLANFPNRIFEAIFLERL
jgi:hypothetical protein